MAQPTYKDPGINRLLSEIAGKDREATIQGDKCMTCNDPDMNFRDDLSRKEYTISGMCQRCQDNTFGDDPED